MAESFGCSDGGSDWGAFGMLFLCALGGAAGAVAGLVQVPPDSAAAEASLFRAIDERAIKEDLHASLSQAARAAGVQVVDPPSAQVDQTTNTVLKATIRSLGTAAFPGINAPATIAEDVFLLYPFPYRETRRLSAEEIQTPLGLAPIHPVAKGKNDWPAVDPLHPHFSWHPFPRPEDRQAAPQDMERVSSVTYELMIAREENGVPGAIVHHAKGLVENEHEIPFALEPGKRFFWTVRPRFVLDGRPRVSEWSVSRRSPIIAPSRNAYRASTR